MINAGLIGYGLAGSVFHAPLIASVPELRLSKVVSSRRDQIAKDLPGVAAVPDISDVLADPFIDLLVIAAPSANHFEHATAALQAGKHVVVDKPFATTAREADELIALAESQGLILTGAAGVNDAGCRLGRRLPHGAPSDRARLAGQSIPLRGSLRPLPSADQGRLARRAEARLRYLI